MIRKLFPIFVAMVVVLAFGSVHAQTTVKIAVLENVLALFPDDEVVIIGDTGAAYTFSGACMANQGFDGEYPIRDVVVIDPSGTPTFIVVATSNEVSGRLSNFVLVSTCTEAVDVYRIYTADVSPTPTTIIAIVNTVSVVVTDRLIITGVALPSDQFSSQCMADLGFGGVTPGARSVVITLAVAQSPLVNFWFRDPLPPGTRVSNITLITACFDGGITSDVIAADVAAPTAGGPLLVAAPPGVTLDSNAESVAKSDSDPDGISNFVCIQPGSAAEHTELWCDVPIERGDRIVGFHSPLVDPDTGITYWWAELEY